MYEKEKLKSRKSLKQKDVMSTDHVHAIRQVLVAGIRTEFAKIILSGKGMHDLIHIIPLLKLNVS